MHDTYTLLREFADSWMLLALTAFFGGVCLWAFRPGSRPIHDDAARAIFREEPEPLSVAGCAHNRTGCTCSPKLETRK